MADSSNQTILVTGATGNQGGAIARHLLQRGFTVRGSLDRALQGAWGVFSMQTFQGELDGEIRDGRHDRRCSKSSRDRG